MNNSFQKVSQLQHALSFLMPISIRKWVSNGEQLELDYYKGEYRLSTTDTYYSNGIKYRPFYKSYTYLQEQQLLQNIKDVLVLGGGLAANVLMFTLFGGFREKRFQIVEFDATIASICDAILAQSKDNINYKIVVQDAYQYVLQTNATFDLINLDVFINRSVPKQFCSQAYLRTLYDRLNADGILIMNYMVHDANDWKKLQQILHSIFATVHIINQSPNRFIICRK